jgi:predicted transcriptional regulator YheO
MSLLSQYQPIGETIAALLYPHAEVVIHDLKTQQVIALINNFSQREVGSPSLVEEVEFTAHQSVIGPYEKLNWDGRKLKSITTVLRDEQQQAVGLMCINLDVSDMDRTLHALTAFLQPANLQPQPPQLFKHDWHEKINVYVNQWLQGQSKTISGLSRSDKRLLVGELYLQGAFNGPKAAEYVAKIIGLGRATIFNYLRELKR